MRGSLGEFESLRVFNASMFYQAQSRKQNFSVYLDRDLDRKSPGRVSLTSYFCFKHTNTRENRLPRVRREEQITH